MSENWQKIEELFHDALERDPAGREAFLDEACAGDAALRAEVASLLAADQRAGGFLERPAADVSEALVEPDDSPASPGARFGPYLIKDQIGRGGMGIVYLAEDTRLGRPVALKVLPGGVAHDERRRERMRIEARAAARLAHPNIATLYALEELDGKIALVFEFVRGRTLRAEMAQARLSARAVVDLGVQIARALAAAHASKIVHRDLKPENVILGEHGVAKVLDFGVARLTQDASGAAPRLTEAGTRLGTPAYMSPEQLEGGDVDARSDLFAFGILMYELASGANPFDAPTPISAAARILFVEPPALAGRQAGVPPALDRILRRCLQKAPADRYQSTLDLVADLERLQREMEPGRPTPGSALQAPDRQEFRGPRRWWTLHQLGVMLTYSAAVYPLWLARDYAGGRLALVPLIAAIVAMVFNGTLRVHLLFTATFNAPALPQELRRASPWVRRSDCAVGAMLVLGALPVAAVHTALAVVLIAVGIGVTVVSVMIEPATRRAAFPSEPLSGDL